MAAWTLGRPTLPGPFVAFHATRSAFRGTPVFDRSRSRSPRTWLGGRRPVCPGRSRGGPRAKRCGIRTCPASFGRARVASTGPRGRWPFSSRSRRRRCVRTWGPVTGCSRGSRWRVWTSSNLSILRYAKSPGVKVNSAVRNCPGACAVQWRRSPAVHACGSTSRTLFNLSLIVSVSTSAFTTAYGSSRK